MTESMQKHPGRDCPPEMNHADQPRQPGAENECDPLRESTPPTLDPPEKCDSDSSCKCPEKPASTSNCLEALIAKQAAEIAAAEKARTFKTDLETLLNNAKSVSTTYTRDNYVALVTEWQRQDGAIAELIRKLVCAVPCWRCILECYVCPLLNELHYAEKWLYDDGKQYTEVHNLYDLQYWHLRDRNAKERRFKRIKTVLDAWGNPSKTIGDQLAANKTLYDATLGIIGNQPGKAIYDVFLQLVPMHLAIAPPAVTSNLTTRIDKKYTQFCECSQGQPDNCCGPDVGEWSLRQRLVGPQPYLIDPNDYFTLICCLVEKRYVPAKDALSKAEAEWTAIGERIANYEGMFKDGWVKKFGETAKGAIPSVVICSEYECDDENVQKPPSAY